MRRYPPDDAIPTGANDWYITTSFRLPMSMVDRIDRWAPKGKRSRFVRAALEKELRKRERKASRTDDAIPTLRAP